MQDNLEFIQWLKQFWDNSQAYEYDYSREAVERRKNSPGGLTAGRGGGGGSGPGPARSTPSTAPVRRGPSAAGARAPSVTASRSGRLSAASGRASPADHNAAIIQDLTRQMNELRVNADGLEKERDFYFQKLRDIEILLQDVAAMEEPPTVDELVQTIQDILYSTGDGVDGGEGEGYEEVY
jgi:RP/EB family microtubule-associated protein